MTHLILILLYPFPAALPINQQIELQKMTDTTTTKMAERPKHSQDEFIKVSVYRLSNYFVYLWSKTYFYTYSAKTIFLSMFFLSKADVIYHRYDGSS